MGVEFNFENAGRTKFGTIFRPVAKISFQAIKSWQWVSVWMVVDTGADYTILPRYLAETLEISLERDCLQERIFGVGGEQLIYLYRSKINVRVGHLNRTTPIAFLDNNEVPALLGRLGFIETFDTEFLKSHKVIFKD
jgi:hypothetical protein